MALSAVVERELRVALRKFNPRKSRMYTTLIASGITVLLFLFSFSGSRSTQTFHQLLFLFGLYMAVVRPAQIAVGLFTEERRSQTLELLFLTGLNARELFFNKLLGGILIASMDLLALMPFLAIPFLIGGLSFSLFIATIVCLPVLLIFVVAVSVFASVVCEDDGSAMVLTVIIIVALSLITPAPYSLGQILTGAHPFSSAWLWLSPAYAPWLVSKGFGATLGADFWPTISITLVWACFCLLSASTVLSRNWRNDPNRSEFWWRKLWKKMMDGSDRWRSTLRLTLEKNAFQWLAQRNRRPLLLGWILLGAIILVWLLGWMFWPRAWPSTMNFFVTATLLIISLNWIEQFAAAREIGQHRRDGTLELLLTTPLSPAEIVSGQVAASHAHFHTMRLFVLSICAAMMLAGFWIRAWSIYALVSYIVIWAMFFGWCWMGSRSPIPLTIWVALNSGGTRSVFRFQGGGLFQWLWVFYNLRNVGSAFGNSALQFPNGSLLELIIVIIVAVVMTLVFMWNHSANAKLETELEFAMREIAQEPVPDANDPRFKKWKDLRTRLSHVK